MMDEKDKREFLEDGLSARRRENFEAASLKGRPSSMSLDEYICFLEGIQKIFGPFPVSREITDTRDNKL